MTLHYCNNPDCVFNGLDAGFVQLYKLGLVDDVQLAIQISIRDEKKQYVAEPDGKILCDARKLLQQKIKEDVNGELPIEIFLDPKKFDAMAMELLSKSTGD